MFLAEHGYIAGVSVSKPNRQHHLSPTMVLDKTMMGNLIEGVSKCSDEFDEGVHLQVFCAPHRVRNR